MIWKMIFVATVILTYYLLFASRFLLDQTRRYQCYKCRLCGSEWCCEACNFGNNVAWRYRWWLYWNVKYVFSFWETPTRYDICRTGTRLSKRLYPDGTSRPGSEPVDRVDEAAMRHDIQYDMYKDRRHRLDADKAMIYELINIEKPTCRERIQRVFVLPIMFVKRCITACLLRIPIINR